MTEREEGGDAGGREQEEIGDAARRERASGTGDAGSGRRAGGGSGEGEGEGDAGRPERGGSGARIPRGTDEEQDPPGA